MRSSPEDARMSANVVDIRRFSTHDGNGIRTTIFLKGCSLECAWCQNPETINARRNPVFFRSRCIDCGICVRAATCGEARQNAAGETFVDTTVKDADWENLASLCPTGAIRFDSRRYTVAELVGVAQRDRVFFGEGGGVTLSGGEPLFLPHFAAALLKALKEAGMNTAIETALNVRPEFLAEALPHADHVFADCKLIDDDAHRRYVGAPNDRILANLATLLTGERRADVTVRTPLIPGVTDGEDNIAGIASYISGLYPAVRYELLNYNPLAAAKYDVLPGREFLFTPEQNPKLLSEAQMEALRGVARANGVENLIVD